MIAGHIKAKSWRALTPLLYTTILLNQAGYFERWSLLIAKFQFQFWQIMLIKLGPQYGCVNYFHNYHMTNWFSTKRKSSTPTNWILGTSNNIIHPMIPRISLTRGKHSIFHHSHIWVLHLQSLIYIYIHIVLYFTFSSIFGKFDWFLLS